MEKEALGPGTEYRKGGGRHLGKAKGGRTGDLPYDPHAGISHFTRGTNGK